MQILIKIKHVVQFSLTANGQMDSHSDYDYSADPRVVHYLVMCWVYFDIGGIK